MNTKLPPLRRDQAGVRNIVIFVTAWVRSAFVAGTVFLKIGPDCIKYCVHKALLMHHSEYCPNALRGPWKEAEECVIILEDVEPATGT